MSGTIEPAAGIAVTCGNDGVIRDVLRNDTSLPSENWPGTPLSELVDPSSSGKSRQFLAEILASGAAIDWELGVRVDGAVKLFHFAGAASDGEVIAVGATTREAVLRYYDELMRINNEQANALRTALKTKVTDERDDPQVYDRMMQLNNELATLQRELARKNVELQRANALKNQFVGMAAHDLRNPIGAIQSLSQLLLDDTIQLPPDSSRQFLKRIVASTEFMLALINDLLDISAIESGQLRLDMRDVDIAALVRESVELGRRLADQKGISISLEIAADAGTVPADARKIEQVLQNLLGNAVKFSPLGSIVTVLVRPEGNDVLVCVSDEGPGIPESEVAGIFKPFQRATPKGTAGERSTGLGLAIAKRVMDGHGGRIWYESRSGKGSTFNALLPRSR